MAKKTIDDSNEKSKVIKASKSGMCRNQVLFFFFNKLINLFLAVLGLRFCARAFSSCGERGPLFIAVRGPLTIAAFLVAEHRLQTRKLSRCGSRDQLLRGMWDLPRPGLEPASPALAGGFSTAAPPGKPRNQVLFKNKLHNSFRFAEKLQHQYRESHKCLPSFPYY